MWANGLNGIGWSLGLAALTSGLAATQQQPTADAQGKHSLIAFRAVASTPNPHSALGRDSIYVVSADGGEPMEILSGIYNVYDPFQIQWVPGAQIIVVSADIPQSERFGMGVFPNIWVADCEQPDKPACIGASSAEFAVSPDGDRVAYVRYGKGGGSEIHVVPLHTDGETLATDGSWKVWEPCWSPDGRYVVHRAGLRKGRGADTGSWGMYRLDVKNGRREKIAGQYSFAQFLPGGNSLLVMDYDWPKGPKTLHRLDVASGKTTALATGLAPFPPALSVDGARIACVLANEESLDDSDRIVTVGLGGDKPREVARGCSPTWSPDGRRLAYEREGFVYVLELATAVEKKLVEGNSPSWSR